MKFSTFFLLLTGLSLGTAGDGAAIFVTERGLIKLASLQSSTPSQKFF